MLNLNVTARIRLWRKYLAKSLDMLGGNMRAVEET